MEKISQFVNKNLIRIAFAFTVIGFIVFICFIAFLSFDGYGIRGKDINMNATGQVGDFIGGVVGSLWSLVSVLLFYRALTLQREDLQNQREELRLGRLEFTVNRITNIIYKQAEIFNGLSFVHVQSRKICNWDKHMSDLPSHMSKYSDNISAANVDKDLQRQIENEVHLINGNYEINDYIETLTGTVTIILSLINDKNTNDEYLLDQITRDQLTKVFKFNVTAEKHITYLKSLLKFINLERVHIQLLDSHSTDSTNQKENKIIKLIKIFTV